MKTTLILVLFLFTISCIPPYMSRRVCNCQQEKEVEKFVADHIKDAKIVFEDGKFKISQSKLLSAASIYHTKAVVFGNICQNPEILTKD